MPPSVGEWHRELREDLEKLRGLDLVLLVNRGNRGDGAIHLGGRTLLKASGLTWREVYEPDAPDLISADVLLVFANGAFCRATHTMVETTRRLARGVKRIILLPGSFDLSEPRVTAFAREWDSRFSVYCREQVSYQALQKVVAPAVTLKLSHDLAFAADLIAWANRPHAGKVGIFRRDKEITFERRPTDMPRFDASHGPDSEVEVLLEYVSRYSEIHTDRTHAAITGAMMGRKVWMYCNCYYKNEAIYHHSLSSMPNVHFVGRQPFSLREFARAMIWKARRHAFKARARLRAMRTPLPQPVR